MTSAPRTAGWQPATVVAIREETHRVKTLQFDVAGWPGHWAGQHADVRLTAPDGYRAERSYSIASPQTGTAVDLTIDRLDDGEVSPFLTGTVREGDILELRGPIGRHFAWTPAGAGKALLLVGGGSGVVPLMCILRERRRAGVSVPAALLYSVRTRRDVIYRDELMAMAANDAGFTLRITLTRDRAVWAGQGRVDLAAVAALVRALPAPADCFVCGPNGFVETAARLLIQAGQPPATVRTERFGPTGS